MLFCADASPFLQLHATVFHKQLLQAGRFTKADFQQVLAYLQASTPLPEKYDDHVIKKRKPDRALFIKGNWLLIYRVEPDAIRLIDVGRHGEI